MQERRQAIRYPAVLGRAWVGWREGNDFPRRAAWVIDVSAGGCLLAVDGETPARGTVLVRLDGPYLPEWYEASIRECRGGGGNVSALRLTFPQGCPYELFMGLAYGRFPAPPRP